MTDEKEKMNSEQYRSLVTLITTIDENQTIRSRELKEHVNSKIEGVGHEIRDMKEVLSAHNSRLRKTEEQNIRTEERQKMMKELIQDCKDNITDHKKYCSVQILKTRRLFKLDKFLDWMMGHPWQAVTIMFTILLFLLTIANALWHLISE